MIVLTSFEGFLKGQEYVAELKFYKCDIVIQCNTTAVLVHQGLRFDGKAENISLLKFVHFKDTFAESSFLSKVFLIVAEIETKSAKMTTLLKEMRIAQQSS